MKRRIIIIAVSILLGSFCSAAFSQESLDYEVLNNEFEKLKRDYEELVKDRDNILAQAKNLLAEKTGFRKLEEKTSQLNNYADRLKQDKNDLVAKIKDLEMTINGLHDKELEKIEQIDNLKKHIENMEIEYKIVKESKAKISTLEAKNKQLKKETLGLNTKIQNIEGQRLEARAASEAYRRQIKDLRKQYRDALSRNKKFEKELGRVPKKFAEISRENRMLIKETALMHYNLGVFYMESDEPRRAIAEFEKAIELNPDDAYAHFNIGYIYAEYIVDRPKAIEHFQQFLRLAKRDDADVDWVRKYIITWQAWGGKKPLK